MHGHVGLAVVPEAEVDALAQHLDGRLRAVRLRLRHAHVVHEHHAVAAYRRTEHACECTTR